MHRWLLCNAVRHARADCYRTLFIVITEWSIHMLLFSVLSLLSAICVIELKCFFLLLLDRTFCSDHDQWMWLRERKLPRQEDSEGEVTSLWRNRRAGWLHLPTLRLPQLHLLPGTHFFIRYWAYSSLICFTLQVYGCFFANIDGASVAVTFFIGFKAN